jgi:Skp family chaperone for outer membrane proteins
MMWNTIHCCNCGVAFQVLDGHNRELLQSKKLFWCPNGHQQRYTENNEDKLRREVQRLQQHQAMLEDEKAALRRTAASNLKSAQIAKAKLEKAKQRNAAGVCLECNRSFGNLQRHMAHVHGHVKVKHDGIDPLPLP